MWNKLNSFCLKFTFFLHISKTISTSQDINLDLNDILNDQFMPATLFLSPFVKGTNVTRNHFYSSPSDKQNGTSTINDALNIMKFHRKKMNEYMARNFLAKQIISSLALNPERMQRRLGIAEDDNFSAYDGNDYNRVKFPTNTNPNNLLYDTGSIGYKKWLEKSTTLDDIQRQFSINSSLHNGYEASQPPLNVKLSFKKRNRNSSAASTVSEETDERDDENEYEEGEITGYIYPKQNMMYPTNAPIVNTNPNYGYPDLQQINYAPQNPIKQVYTYHRPQTPSPMQIGTAPAAQQTLVTGYESYRKYPAQIMPTAKSKSVVYYQSSGTVENGNSAKNPKISNVHHQYSNQIYNKPSSQAVNNFEQHETKKQGYYGPSNQENYENEDHHYPVETTEKKELSLKDVLDIALTTLAFLSFGMFILQVLMCITMSNSTYNYSGNMLMMTPMDGSTEADDGIEEIRRKRRSIELDRIEKVNELSKRILLSIDSYVSASEDNGKCLQRILCENNLFARQQKNGQKFWVPIWSLALSWLTNGKGLALQGLKATAIGLGGGNCESFTGCFIGSRK